MPVKQSKKKFADIWNFIKPKQAELAGRLSVLACVLLVCNDCGSVRFFYAKYTPLGSNAASLGMTRTTRHKQAFLWTF